MKYCVLIMDGAADRPLPQRGGKTPLELAHTPHLDALAQEGVVGLARTVPPGMEPSSACACMSILGYNPKAYYCGRGAIEARSLGIPLGEAEVVFRCNLVAVRQGKMWSYSSGHISSEEGRELMAALQQSLGSDRIHFYPGVSYRNICVLKGYEDTLQATCTPPHDIPDRPIEGSLPRGPGSELLRDLMSRSVAVLEGHPVNIERRARGDIPATMIWLFWGSGRMPELPPFHSTYGLEAAMTSGVGLLMGLAQLTGMERLHIPGVTDSLDNDYAAQAAGALRALDGHDLVVIHVEAPDEAAHAGSIDDKVKAIESIDREMVGRLCSWHKDGLSLLVASDHATPIEIRTHAADPVPFLLWGPGFASAGAKGFSEAEAKDSGVFIEEGHSIMSRLTT